MSSRFVHVRKAAPARWLESGSCRMSLDLFRARRAPLKPAGFHELRTHVVDETAGICNLIRDERLGVGWVSRLTARQK